MTEKYLNYLEEENMLLTIAYQHDFDYDIFTTTGRLLYDLNKEMELSRRAGDKARANKLEKNIDYIKFWLDRKRN